MQNNKYGVDFYYYKVKWPLDLTLFNSSFTAVCPNNILSINMHDNGSLALIKAPAGIVHPDTLTIYEDPPIAMVTSPPWTPNEV